MKKNKKAALLTTATKEDASKLFPVVGIGASAGGLEAFSQLLSSLSTGSGIAYVLVQHLDPHHETLLSDILSKVSNLPIEEATHDLKVMPDHVYIIPPNTSMTIHEGVLKLIPREYSGNPFLPINIFLHSLAKERKNHSIGVILSGTGNDGTEGLESIKAAGGITFAQTQATAKYQDMPQNAIQAGCVDFTLPPNEIGQEITRISKNPYMGHTQSESALATDEEHYKQILDLLRTSAGVDFTSYRDTTIKRRILRRMVLHSKNTLQDYITFLNNNSTETEALYNDLLINVTSFFREPETFEALKTKVFPELIKNNKSSQVIRIWVTGCSTGQEAYSLAIVLMEFLSDKDIHPNIQIFATDLSEEIALKKAREGRYPDAIESEVTPERLQRFFTKEGNQYIINKSIREMCVFAKHNVAADPPFSRMDLISCRNLLIYLALPLQRRILPTFHYALNPGGFLLLGASETIGVFTDLFGTVDQSLRIYCKKSAIMREYPHFSAKGFPVVSKNQPAVPVSVNPTDWQREADKVVLTKYTPPSVLVNENLDILQFRGKTSPYLESPSGEPSHNLLRMACEGLFPTLRNAIEECHKQNIIVHRKGVCIRKDEKMREVDIQVLPVTLPNSGEIRFLVLFEESRVPEITSLPANNTKQDSREIIQLRQELASMHEYLQSIIEEKDTINEELRATNEEFLSSNEELQSTNEELETAKEELQSVNEELTTVNEQLNQRNKELSNLNDQLQKASDYAEAIVRTVREPLVVLDANLRVQTANPAFYKTFHITPEETKDNLFYEIANHAWDIPELRSMLKDILPQKTTLTDFEVRQNFKDIGSKIMLLNACSVVRHTNDIPLFLLAIEDISERKYLEEELQEFSYKLTEAHRQKDEFLATLSHELRNPLAPMHNALEILRLPSKNPKIASQAYEIINYQLTKMVILVDDLLDISRITNGKIALRKEHTELEKIIKNAVETSLPLVESAKHKLTVILPEEPLWLHADPIRISQVLSNLLNNAAKYTKDNGAIQLSAERKENDILIHIKDNGIGLSSEVLPHIFKMFSQVDTSIDRAQDGMGVGLALVKNLVELHGGSIKVASEGLGYGAEFTVSLPWSSAPQGTKKTSSQIAKQESLKNKNGMRILVIDDNKASAQTLGWLLELDLGYKVELAYDGISAIALAKNFIPDVILLDIGLPGMNGYTICQTLHQEYILKDTIIIAQTGWGQEEHRKRSKEAGFDYHLVKPVSLDTLREVLNSIRTQKKIPLTCTG